MSTGLTPTSSAVGMLEPVTMTRSAVAAALDAGTRFPCASRATGAGAPGGGDGEGEGEGPCAGRLDTMAKKIASRTETLRSNPHPKSWIFFIQVRLCLRRIRKTPGNVQCFFSLLIFIFEDVFIIARTAPPSKAALEVQVFENQCELIATI